MSGSSKVIVLDPDPRAGRQVQLGFEREGISTSVPPPDDLQARTFDGAGLVMVGGTDGVAVQLVRRAREALAAASLDIPLVFAGTTAAREDLERAGADEVPARPLYLRDLVTIGRILRGRPAAERDHFAGSLVETTGVYTLVRALSALGRSGVLTLIRGLRRGEIRFFRGEVTSAQVGAIAGQAALHQLLLWTDARFDFTREEVVRRQQIPLSPDELFADAERFLQDIHEAAGSLSPVSVLESDIQRVQDHAQQIPTEVHGILRMFDGHRVLADVLENSPYRVFETLRVAQKAVEAGLLKHVDSQRPKATWKAVLAIDEWLVGSDTRAAVVERTASIEPPKAKAPKGKGKRRSKKEQTVNAPAARPSAPTIDWGDLVPREIGVEVGPLSPVVPSLSAQGEVQAPRREVDRERLEAMDTDKRDRILPTDVALEPSVVVAADDEDTENWERIALEAKQRAEAEERANAESAPAASIDEYETKSGSHRQRTKNEGSGKKKRGRAATPVAVVRTKTPPSGVPEVADEEDSDAWRKMRADAEAKAADDATTSADADAPTTTFERPSANDIPIDVTLTFAKPSDDSHATSETTAASATPNPPATAARPGSDTDAKAFAAAALARLSTESKTKAEADAQAKAASKSDAEATAKTKAMAVLARLGAEGARIEQARATPPPGSLNDAAREATASARPGSTTNPPHSPDHARTKSPTGAPFIGSSTFDERDSSPTGAPRILTSTPEGRAKSPTGAPIPDYRSRTPTGAPLAGEPRAKSTTGAPLSADPNALQFAKVAGEALARVDAKVQEAAARSAAAEEARAYAARVKAAAEAKRLEAERKSRPGNADDAATATLEPPPDPTAPPERPSLDAQALVRQLVSESSPATSGALSANALVGAASDTALPARPRFLDDTDAVTPIELGAVHDANVAAEHVVVRPSINLTQEAAAAIAAGREQEDSVSAAPVNTQPVSLSQVVSAEPAAVSQPVVAMSTEPVSASQVVAVQPAGHSQPVAEPQFLSETQSAAPIETDDEPSDGIIRSTIAAPDSAELARLRQLKPPGGPEHDGPPVKQATGEIGERPTEKERDKEASEPSIVIADLAAAADIVGVQEDLAAVHEAASAVATPAARPPADAASESRELEVSSVRRDAVAFSDDEEAFFNKAESHTHSAPRFESFDDLDDGYEPPKFWERVFGKKKPKKP